MSRLEVVGETLRHTLNVLATTAPDWLRAHTTPAWVDRYGLRASEFRLPKSEAGRRAWAVHTGVDGFMLLALAKADGAPPALRGAAVLETLRQVWVQNFLVEHGPEGPRVDWRANDQVPPSGRYIGSPYDTEARYATKGATVWSGYKVHLTETCDEHPELDHQRRDDDGCGLGRRGDLHHPCGSRRTGPASDDPHR